MSLAVDIPPFPRRPRPTPFRRRAADSRPVESLPGMPPLDYARPRIPTFKRLLPEKLFYVPLGFMLAALALRHRSLSLPSAANPGLDAGGLWGESKAACLGAFGPEAQRWTARWAVLRRSGPHAPAARDLPRALAAMAEAELDFPVYAKPDRGYQGWGIRRLTDAAALRDYLEAFPPRETVMLQEAVDLPGEAGLFYVREPGAARGRIFSLALTYPPHLVGDGRSSLRRLILADPLARKDRARLFALFGEELERVPARDETLLLADTASARMGAVYLDARDFVTPALEQRIEAICNDIPGFHFGRFDLRFGSIEALRKGRGFRIVELNGAGAEALHIWAGGGKLIQAYRTLWQQWKLAFEIGARNAAAGHAPIGWRELRRLQKHQERLRRLYPQTG